MKLNLNRTFSQALSLSFAVASLVWQASGATFFVSQQSTNPVPPYMDWATAATNIQDAIDVATDGDLVLVTNGVYAAGGKVMDGDLTNRVALDKALTVQSVNGPTATVIQGVGPVGVTAVRCAWLTNGAALNGFTLQGGATRAGNSSMTLSAGAGVWCSGTNAFINDCVIRNNAASVGAGGCYRGTLNNCAVTLNSVAAGVGSGVWYGCLVNCTVTYNTCSPAAGGVSASTLTNCIVQYNTGGNYAGSSFSFCCTTPLPIGNGNVSVDPQLLADGVHLSINSPCRSAGTNLSVGADLDGQPWANPPSIGCDEWWPEPVVSASPAFQYVAPNHSLALSVCVAGAGPFTCWWSKDGANVADSLHYSAATTTNLVVNDFAPSDAGEYQVVVSNAFGVATSPVGEVVLHCVDAASANPVPPYTNWQTAASCIQDAIDAASDGHLVLVTNGVYASGGKVMAGDLTNRVALDKALTVQSVNGCWATIIQGAGATNGPNAVRCAWLANNAALKGFTLRWGATRLTGDPWSLQSGGGVWCASSNALVVNCLVRSNTAVVVGGGVYQGTLYTSGVQTNISANDGGGTYNSTLYSCTVSGNYARGSGRGVYGGSLVNSIVYSNSGSEYVGSVFSYSCTTPLPPGIGNISSAPQFLTDGLHLASTSPCRGTGTNVTLDVDIDGQGWATPPAIGCDEWLPAPLIVEGPRFQFPTGSRAFNISVTLAGQGPFTCWWTKDGLPVEDNGHYSWSHSTNLVVDALVYPDVGTYQVVVSNSFGMVTSAVAQLVVHCVDAAGTSPVPPYTNWSTAAASIQDAIDAAVPGEVVLVTNGVYATGGKVMAGDLLNRVAVDKALRVQSVNGFAVTTIQGAGATNGTGAVRCVGLTNGASLIGFTLQGGATRTSSDPKLGYGGGAWCSSPTAVIANCLIRSNTAYWGGVGAYQGTLRNCAISGNTAVQASGYGICQLANLVNCTVSGNTGWGAVSGNFTNCVLYFNTLGNYSPSGSTFSYCCATPLPPGIGNIAAAPQFMADGLHLANSSPCRGAGTNLVMDPDIDGQSWANPPSIGCDEWQAIPLLIAPPRLSFNSDYEGFTLSVVPAGQEPLVCWWIRDGVLLEDDGHYSSSHTTNLVADGVSPLDVGNYQVVVSNAFGMVTSAVAQVVAHYVDAAATSPVLPYTSWATAATNIQDAINAAQAGEIVLVTNGIYCSGGKVMAGDLTNRVALDKPLIVQSVNGPGQTIIQGDSSRTNGPLAVRCAWLTNGASLVGFTLTGGATRTSGDFPTLLSGGAVWSSSTNASVMNCILATNTASAAGGGAFQVKLNQCTLTGNTVAGVSYSSGGTGGGAANCTLKHCRVSGNAAWTLTTLPALGGGVYYCNVRNSLITGNTASVAGGGAYQSTLVNCTLTGNTTTNRTGYGGGYVGTGGTAVTNCIVYGNRCLNSSSPVSSNYSGGTFAFCCTAPLASGTRNIAADPQLLGDGVHLATSSPCRWTGTNAVVSGTDLEGQPWANPPSMGCDEWQAAPQVVVQPKAHFAGVPGKVSFGIDVAGQGPFGIFWSKDGLALEDGGKCSSTHTTNLVVRQLDVPDAGSYQVVVSNAFGMATSQVAQVVVHCVDAMGLGAVAPYSTWATASTTIQDAIDTASAGDFVLVTNGLYATGGKVAAGDLTNRVAVDKALTLMSMNGPEATTIQGAWDPVSTNGPGAVRCAWLTNGATLTGFTLQGGATRAVGDMIYLRSGGGVCCADFTPLAVTVDNCIIRSNAASYRGGGVSGGEVYNCQISGNRANYGGGVYWSYLYNCLIEGNLAFADGGGAYGFMLNNCTVVGNSAGGSGGGVYGFPLGVPALRNSIVYFNSGAAAANVFVYNMPSTYADGCCTTPWFSGMLGGTTADPQLVDGFHLAATSPCRGLGSSLYTTGTDLEGEAWLNPPSIGCDEVLDLALPGPLAVGIEAAQTEVLANRPLTFTGRISGRASGLAWTFGDGPATTNASFITSHAWTNAGDYTLTFTAFNADNPAGVSTDLLVHVTLPAAPQLGTAVLGTNGMQFQFIGQSGVRYVMEMTTNLVPPIVWQSMQTNMGTGSLMQMADPVSTDAVRFYRVRAE